MSGRRAGGGEPGREVPGQLLPPAPWRPRAAAPRRGAPARGSAGLSGGSAGLSGGTAGPLAARPRWWQAREALCGSGMQAVLGLLDGAGAEGGNRADPVPLSAPVCAGG